MDKHARKSVSRQAVLGEAEEQEVGVRVGGKACCPLERTWGRREEEEITEVVGFS